MRTTYSKCYGHGCDEEIGNDPVLLVTTGHVRMFCTTSCLRESLIAHDDWMNDIYEVARHEVGVEDFEAHYEAVRRLSASNE